MPEKHPKRPRDLNQWAKRMVARDRERPRAVCTENQILLLVMKTAEDRLRCDDAEARSITLYSEDGWMLLLVAIILAAVFFFVAVS